MGFQIKRKGAVGAFSQIEDKYEDAVHVANGLVRERVVKSRTTITNLKTGDTMSEAEIEEAALSVGPRKKRAS